MVLFQCYDLNRCVIFASNYARKMPFLKISPPVKIPLKMPWKNIITNLLEVRSFLGVYCDSNTVVGLDSNRESKRAKVSERCE